MTLRLVSTPVGSRHPLKGQLSGHGGRDRISNGYWWGIPKGWSGPERSLQTGCAESLQGVTARDGGREVW